MLNKEDMVDRYKVIQHFRDLLNLSTLIEYDAEMSKITAALKELGWSSENLAEMKIQAASFTIWEEQIDRPVKESGDLTEWHKIKNLHK